MLGVEKTHPILDSIADGVFTVDRDFCITSFNRAAEEITGFSRSEAIGRQCSEVFSANICKRDCALRSSIETGQELVDVPVRIHNRNGVEIPITISTAILYDRDHQPIGGVETFRDLTALNELREQIDNRIDIEDIIGRHPRMHQLLEIVPEVAGSDATVLLQGASGSGKGLIAKTIHDLGPRSEGPFIKVNCAALPDALLESELFGYLRGAFTDARKDKPGRVALAEGGTLFLDEIGDIPLSFQVKLLRLIQDREYEPLGGTTTEIADIRFIAATNRDLSQLMREGSFREDLFYRLNVVPLTLPSLAERREDVPRLTDRILRRLNARMAKRVRTISSGAMDRLLAYPYPGNVRELENAIEHALVLCHGSTIEERHLPAVFLKAAAETVPTDSALGQAEAETIRETLRRFGGNRTKAAEALGLHRSTLWRKMQRHGLS